MPLSKADDIRDFQIEGMSIGDSALDFFSETKINNGLKNWYKDKTYNYSSISKPNFANKYEKIGFFYKPNDEKYIMVSISGIMFCKSDIRKCENMHTEVENEFNKLFKNIKKEKKVFSYPKTEANGEGSKAIQIFYKFCAKVFQKGNARTYTFEQYFHNTYQSSLYWLKMYTKFD